MNLTEQLSEITSKMVDICDDYDKGRFSTGDTIYRIWEYRRILENIIAEERYDDSRVPELMYAIDKTMAEILMLEAERIDDALQGKISLKNYDFTWKKEGGKES